MGRNLLDTQILVGLIPQMKPKSRKKTIGNDYKQSELPYLYRTETQDALKPHFCAFEKPVSQVVPVVIYKLLGAH